MARPDSRILEELPPAGAGDSKELKAARKKVADLEKKLAAAKEHLYEVETNEKGR